MKNVEKRLEITVIRRLAGGFSLAYTVIFRSGMQEIKENSPLRCLDSIESKFPGK